MPLPKPEPGLVIHYEYLWRNEHEDGSENGSKKRPCAIIVAVATATGQTEAVVAPITHSQPTPPSVGVLIPPMVKKHLGLDDEPSWVIANDLNVFMWPGVDIYPVPNTPSGTFEYGLLPPLLFDKIKALVEEHGGTKIATRRTE